MNATISRRTLGALCLAVVATTAVAQGPLPTKPLRIVVGYPAGQTVDIIARNYAAALTRELGQPVYVDNRAGANGSLGAQEVKKSAPDGSTLLLGTLGQMAINPTLYKKLPYDTLKDFAPVSMVSMGPLLLVANPSFPANDVKELIAYAKARPGKVDFGSGGNGITAHLAMEMFQAQAGIQLNHIPYKGSPAALNDLMGGQVSLMFDAVPAALPHVKSGKLKALAISGLKRNPQLPSLPTMDEQGLKGFDVNSWVGFLAPAGTPPATVEALNAAIHRAAASPELQEATRAIGSEVMVDSPTHFAAFLQTEVKKWGKAVTDGRVQID
ncbi:Bug family tripartite tricarboxylate transporter substrate binding protein [Variovorax sp. PAMC26660]|uniref:Bug family tripartite tricarboxylate transporter substrate binding protein n=1 Tax=Variovorax sp. PAMC26660 TaxID=2762322 RepID=UPI00164D5598|nr:tripartite tricarboxylate transporter substrate binding protein [Variovorax sp. PAMC26660]QNK65077.1 tripartite tricarboxylate transporter substrate binding protein [Variovorax sp. PAMC26660]